MSTLLLATADMPWQLANGWVASTGAARTGTKSFYHNLAYGANQLSFPLTVNSSELYLRYCMNCALITYSTLYTRFGNTTAAIIAVMSTTTGALELRQGSNTDTLLHTVSNVVQENIWITIELHVSTTSVTLKINGMQVYTNNALTIALNDISLLTSSGIGTSSATTWKGYVDDIVVCTDKWPGQGGLHVFEPTGTGTTTNWSSSIPTLSTPADTAGTRHQFTLANAPATAAHVHRLGIAVSAKVDGQGYGRIVPGLNTDFTKNPEGLSVSPKFIQRYWPGVSLVDFNDLEIGVQSA